jgi:hypothetical protein
MAGIWTSSDYRLREFSTQSLATAVRPGRSIAELGYSMPGRRSLTRPRARSSLGSGGRVSDWLSLPALPVISELRLTDMGPVCTVEGRLLTKEGIAA